MTDKALKRRDGKRPHNISQLNGLKALSIIIVVMWHVTLRGVRRLDDFGMPTPYRWMPHGEIAVDIFFLISGIVIALPFIGKSQWNMGNFYLRRFFRIYPPYLFAISICAIGVWKKIASPENEFLSSLFYMNGIFRNTQCSIDPPVWSLEVEIQFYFIIPLIYLFYLYIDNFKKRTIYLLSFILVILIITAEFHSYNSFDGRFRYALFAHFLMFGLGVILADSLCCFEWRSSYAWDGLFLVALAATYLIGIWLTKVNANPSGFISWFFTVFAEGLTSLLLVVGGINGKISGKILSQSWMSFLGCMTYSIYLVHVPVIEELNRLFLKNIVPINLYKFWIVWFSISFISVSVVSLLFYFLVEKPFAKISSKMKKNPSDLVQKIPIKATV